MLSASLNKTFPSFHSTDRIAHTTAFVTPVVEHWLVREIAQWDHHEESIGRPIAPWANALTTELHLASTQARKHGTCCMHHPHADRTQLWFQWRSRGYCRPGPNIYGRPYWCSRNTFAIEIAAPVKVTPPRPSPPPCTATAWFHY